MEETKQWSAENVDNMGPWYGIDGDVPVPGYQVRGPASLGNGELSAYTREDATLMAAAPLLRDTLRAVLDHVEDEAAERVNGQCTLCHSYRQRIRDALAAAREDR